MLTCLTQKAIYFQTMNPTELLLSLGNFNTNRKVIKTEERAQKKRLWLPMGIRRVFFWAGSDNEPSSDIMDTLELTQSIPARQQKTRWGKRQPEEESGLANTCAALLDNMRKTNDRQRHRLSRIFLALLDWFTNPEGLHALCTLIVTIALAIPAAIPSSAGFYYREKGL
ncbi:hypothetical protein BHE90_004839 [Fusarium euwallaceae]|uniref:Uncharacterized protein n=2 Tax=Fusarium solani species complex TaxID=232080 RepID=A0A430LY33_9HYPO|nr:hypothetical protein CEP51_012870 [Fusarium floridanum]RTE80643.1 hypothetical protein BHE90_004839 [Fusarium euwallaceae]